MPEPILIEPTRSDILVAVTRLEARLGTIESTTKQTHQAIYGNGTPTEGMVHRMAKLEEALETGVEMCATNAKAIADLTSSMKLLGTAVTDHTHTFHISQIIKNKWFWALLLILSVIIHALLEIGSPWINIVLKWLGFPIP